ncbi:MAG TPA: ABC transporter permease [Balneolaceae bacterium]|nr:ABC transporter permease [Balneolaceae bacterium]|tara:strand:+ start:203140 stop:204360 length:1221 start_codon:yes stop_codon:yes gene_type:complete
MLYLKMAWRNIWRNKRRTLITMASIVMAVVLSAVMSSMQEGQYDQMIDNTVGSFTGHIQIQQAEYKDEPNLDHSLRINEVLFRQVEETAGVKAVVPRIDSYALAGGLHKTKAAMIAGIDIEAEKHLSEPDQKVISGRYFNSNSEHAVLISAGLADYLNVQTGDSLVLISSGFHGVSAADLIPIKGVLKFGIPDMNNGMVYMPLQTAQEFFGAYNRVTALAVMAQDAKGIHEVAQRLSSQLPDDYKVYGWQELMPELIQAIEADRGSGQIILMVLYMVVGFGILGTVLMMTAERKFEFGVLLSIGTSRFVIGLTLILEMATITILGTISGIIASLPFIYYFNINPMEFTGQAAAAIEEYGMEPFIRFSTDPSIIINQAMIVLVITLLISIYPLIHTKRINPVEAMRH